MSAAVETPQQPPSVEDETQIPCWSVHAVWTACVIGSTASDGQKLFSRVNGVVWKTSVEVQCSPPSVERET